MADPITRLNAALEGRYRIERQLGEGGMATVYLADDLRHERKVALKVLKPELAAVVGAERFLAEIKTTANLQHPHILPLFDSGEADSFLFYVMPYVDGESLRDRIEREHQLPVDEAIGIGKKVAAALQAAHEQGVIHRDVKPANILLAKGEPLVSDFGIALAVGAAGGGRLTETGLSLGTPHYMSPEQATGDLSVGAATDIYALGCVLYEMLVGEPPYTGSTPQAVMGKIVTGEADPVTKHRRSVPPNVDAAIQKALEKLPADRFRSAEELARALGNEGYRHTAAGSDHEVESAEAAERAVTHWRATALGALVLAVIVAVGAGWSLYASSAPALVARFPAPFEPGQAPTGPMEFADGGSVLVYKGTGPEESAFGTQLWVRSWSVLQASPIPGTEDTDLGSFAVSPDSRQVAYHAGGGVTQDGSLKLISLDGGPSQTLLDSGVASVWDWTSDGYIYFTTYPEWSVARVPAGGGADAVRVLTDVLPDAEELAHINVHALPGAGTVLFEVLGDGSTIWALDIDTRERRMLARGKTPLNTPTGHLLFISETGQLMAAPMDPATAELTGTPRPILEGVEANSLESRYAVSETGTLIYLEAESANGAGVITPVWVNRSGEATPVDPDWSVTPPSTIGRGIRISPDGDRIAVTSATDGNSDIWIKHLPDGALERLTFDAAHETYPAWSADGTYVTYVSVPDLSLTEAVVYRVRADGIGARELILDDERSVWEPRGTPDGSWLVLRTGSTVADNDIVGVRPGRDTVPVPLIANADYDEYDPALSRDGRWLAYTSEENGHPEVYVRRFPDVQAGKWQISRNGGFEPVWAHNGRELFYVDLRENMMVARLQTGGSTLGVSERERLFDASEFSFAVGQDTYDVAPDGKRFILIPDGLAGLVEQSPRHILVMNWLQELQDRLEQ